MSTHDFRPLRDKMEAAASDLLQVPTYCVLMSETGMAPCRTSDHSFTAIISGSLHRALQPEIGDRWRGAGPCILFDADPLADAYNDPADADTHFASVFTHEVGHAVDQPAMRQNSAISDWVTTAKFRPIIAESVESPDTFYADDDRRSPRDQHGPSWLRATIHVAHRLREMGFPIQWSLTLDHTYYGYSPLIAYVRALGDEPQRLAHLPLTEIPALPIPAPFLDLWHSDCARWPDANL